MIKENKIVVFLRRPASIVYRILSFLMIIIILPLFAFYSMLFWYFILLCPLVLFLFLQYVIDTYGDT